MTSVRQTIELFTKRAPGTVYQACPSQLTLMTSVRQTIELFTKRAPGTVYQACPSQLTLGRCVRQPTVPKAVCATRP